MHCGRFIPAPLSRREMLARCANGFGAVALAGLLGDRAFGASPASLGGSHFAAKPPHFDPKCRNVIFLYMDGGPSSVDTFDPKPLLEKEHGQPFKLKMEPTL
jgi:hypothetical protein